MQPLAERDSGERYPLRLIQCANCTLVQLSHIPDQREVFPPDHPYTTGTTRAMREHFAALAARLNSSLKFGDLIVDIGANDGTLLAACGEKARCVAVEPTDQAAKCRAQGFRTWQQFFTASTARDILHVCGPAKVITACNVFAHVPDPHDFLEGVLALLGDDGTLIIETHDWASLANGLQVDTVYHEHARFYSVASLSYLLARHGLLVREAVPIPVHGGSFRAFAVREQQHLQARAAKAADHLYALIRHAAAEGPVYGIGATTRATPLIHYAGIKAHIACVCEVPGSEKTGQNIPGTSIPVVDEAKLIADQPPHALLLSWHLADSIVPSLRAKGYQGRFIVPLPEARFLDA